MYLLLLLVEVVVVHVVCVAGLLATCHLGEGGCPLDSGGLVGVVQGGLIISSRIHPSVAT